MVLVGMQPVLTQVPPKSLRSMMATFIPALANRCASGGPACPVPMIIASYFVIRYCHCLLSIPRPVSEFFQHHFQKVFHVRGARFLRDADPRTDHLSNSAAALLSGFQRNVEPAGKKGFDQLSFLRAQVDCLRKA